MKCAACVLALAGCLLQFSTRAADSGIDKAKQLITAGDLGQAASLLRQLVSKEPGNADAHLLLGTALALARQRSEALQELARAIDLRPQFAPAYYTLGVALSGFGELEQAGTAFERAIELDPKFADAHVNLAMVLAQSGQYNRAIRHLSTAIEIFGPGPRAAQAHYFEGRIYNERKQPELARRELAEAIRLRPDFGEAYYDLGRTCDKLFDSPCAMRALQKAAELKPNDGGVQYNLGAQYLHAGDTQHALIHLQLAYKFLPAERNVLYSLGLALHRAGREKDAESIFQKLRQMTEGTTSPEGGRLNNEGVQLEDRAELPEALEKYRAAVEVDPLNTVFRRNLGLLLCRLGHWRQGADELKEVLRLDPNDVQATKGYYIAIEKAAPKP